MLKRSLLLATVAIFPALALGAAGPGDAPETPLSSLPYTPGLDQSAVDRAADPCVDFYQYVCGGWVKNNPIPSDQSSWSVYGKMGEENTRFLWGILHGLGNVKVARSPTQQKLGDFFGACMNEPAVEALGKQPLDGMLQRIDAMKSLAALPAHLAELDLKEQR